MDNPDLDCLRAAYRAAADEWIAAWHKWEHAYLAEEQAREKAQAARLAYEDALRGQLYGI